jgi:hypothetical protein
MRSAAPEGLELLFALASLLAVSALFEVASLFDLGSPFGLDFLRVFFRFFAAMDFSLVAVFLSLSGNKLCCLALRCLMSFARNPHLG